MCIGAKFFAMLTPVWSQAYLRFALWFLFWLGGVSGAGTFVEPCKEILRERQQPPSTSRETQLLIEQVENAMGLDWYGKVMQLFRRMDVPPKLRLMLSEELVAASETLEGDPDEMLGNAYLSMGVALFQLNELDRSLEALKKGEAIVRPRKEDFPDLFFRILSNHGAYRIAMGEREDPAKLLNEAIRFAETHKHANLPLSYAYLTLGLLAENSGALNQAMEYMGKAFEHAVSTDKADQAVAAGDSIVAILHVEGQPEMARRWLNQTIPWLDRCQDPRRRFSLLIHEADVLCTEGQNQLAVEKLKGLVEQMGPQFDSQILGACYLSLSGAYISINDYQGALEAAENGVTRLRGLGRGYHLAQVHRMEALIGLGETEKVIEIGEALLKEEISSFPRVRMYELLSRVYEDRGRPVEALRVLRESIATERARLREKAQEQLALLEGLLKNRQREAELELLQEQQRYLTSRAEVDAIELNRKAEEVKHNRQRLTLTVLLSLSALALMLLGVTSYYRWKHSYAARENARRLHEVLRDRLKLQEEELLKETAARRELEIAMERKQQFEAIGKLTGGVAHDFNNLLTIILSSNEMLEQRLAEGPQEAKELVHASTKAAQSGAAIISQLLAYARQKPQSPVAIRISDWLSSVDTLFRKTIGDSIRFQVQDGSQGAVIMIDPAQLTTSILNLLSNARDAMDHYGEIRMSIGRINLTNEDTRKWLDLVSGKYLEFSVRDTGRGIPAVDLERICEPFFTTKETSAGTGLGLSSVLGFVRQSMGDLKVESEVGKGTTVRFVIPIYQGTVIEEVTKNESRAVRTHRHIMVVDDQDDVRFVLASKLQMMGYEVTEFDSAKGAIEWLEEVVPELRPEIVLSDVRMPGPITGIELRNWVLRHCPNIRVILMSGYSDSGSWSPDFLPKPFAQRDLERILGA